VSIDQLISWHRLKKDHKSVSVLSQDSKSDELLVLADGVELKIASSRRVTAASSKRI
jgi:alkylated DNA nucleotide flippase Atl1